MLIPTGYVQVVKFLEKVIIKRNADLKCPFITCVNYSSINIITMYVCRCTYVRFHQSSNSATHPLNSPSCSGYRYQVTPVLCLLKVQFIVISAAYYPTSGRHTEVSVYVGRYTYVPTYVCIQEFPKKHTLGHILGCVNYVGTYIHMLIPMRAKQPHCAYFSIGGTTVTSVHRESPSTSFHTKQSAYTDCVAIPNR